jgi:uncharacterized protein
MIADAHTHIFPSKMISDRSRFFEGEPAFSLLYSHPKARMVGGEELLSNMDEQGVSRSVCFGFPWMNAETCRAGNDAVFEAAQKSDGRLIPFATLPCASLDEAFAELVRCADMGFAGIGELAQYNETDPQKRLAWMMAVCLEVERLGLPVLLHVAEEVGHDYPGKGGLGPKEALAIAEKIENTPVILAHWGGGLFFHELMPELKKTLTNVFYDTAASPYLYDPKILDVAVRIVGADKILFGSDYPLIKPKRYLDQAEAAGLRSEAFEKIFGKNLMKLLEGLKR